VADSREERDFLPPQARDAASVTGREARRARLAATFGSLLRYEHGLRTQQQLADAAGLDRRTIDRLENGRRRRASGGSLARCGHLDVHPFCDQIVQSSTDARDKGKPGWTGRKACARHVATYSVGQFAGAVGVTRALGYRASWSGLLAGTAINAVTHYVIDRRGPLKRFLRRSDRQGGLSRPRDRAAPRGRRGRGRAWDGADGV
jgi:hypothetical protein